MYNILVVDDDKEIVNAIEIYLKREGYNIIKAYNGNEALKKLEENEIHLIILDIMMPEKDGMETLQEIRKNKTIPVILLSAKSEDYDKISGLDTGADDYITKPFNPLELQARVKSALRRFYEYNNSGSKNEIIEIGALTINESNHKCFLYYEEIDLTPIEFSILLYLCKNKGKVVSSEELFENVWKEKYLDCNNTVMVHIKRLREKLHEKPKNPKIIKTVWGIGYEIE